ncbi:MAG: hypothetical protein LH474_00075 [Chamaesiphon sp.]|nr:hypothetical protein [Chamaesiphon sp.]
MVNYIKKSIQITSLIVVVFGAAICDHAPAQAADISQLFGADLTWQCGMTPSIKPRIRLSSNELAQDSVRFNILPCEPAPEPKPAPKPPEAPITQLIQQGVQMLQIAQPLIQQLVQPLTAVGTPPAQQTQPSR